MRCIRVRWSASTKAPRPAWLQCRATDTVAHWTLGSHPCDCGQGAQATVVRACRRLWDVGVYVAVTSVDPLRIYTFDNLLIRHCSMNYSYDLAAAPRESYVVEDEYSPPWAIPSLRPYYVRGLSTANVLRAYLADNGTAQSQHAV